MTKVKTPKPPGRASTYSQDIAAEICRRVAEGSNLDRITQDSDMPSKTAIYAWLKSHETFANDYAQARAMRADSRSDRIDDYGRQMVSGVLTPEQVRVLVDIEKWQAGKENPKKYGDKLAIGGDADAPPIRTESTLTLTPDEAYRRMLDGR